MNVALVERAKAAAQRFDRARKPIVIEFAGTPKAGKTSTVGQVVSFFKRCGFRVEVVVERASVCPVRDKKHLNFNIWTACTTLAQLLEKTQDPPRSDDPQILILDRGIFDSVCWLRMMEHLSRVRKSDRERIESFLLIGDWRKRLSGVVLMTSSPDDAMTREQGHLPVPGASGSIMNPEVLTQVRKTTEDVARELDRSFRILRVDTSKAPYREDPRKTCEKVAEAMLNWIEEQLQEDILVLEKSEVLEQFGKTTCLKGSAAEPILEIIKAKGQFRPREEVEQDRAFVQALPVAVVRNRSGAVLQLKRRERSSENPLNEKLVVWAGGHVRKEDKEGGNCVIQALLRELHEELRLDIDGEKLAFLGAVYSGGGERSSKHLALVFEWRAATDDVAVSLSAAEFFERRGTSLSGRFVSVDELARNVETDTVQEPWSGEIVRELLPGTALKPRDRLF